MTRNQRNLSVARLEQSECLGDLPLFSAENKRNLCNNEKKESTLLISAQHRHLPSYLPTHRKTLVARKLNSAGHFKIFKNRHRVSWPQTLTVPTLKSAFAGNYLSVCPFHGPHLGHATPMPTPPFPTNPATVDEMEVASTAETSSQPVS